MPVLFFYPFFLFYLPVQYWVGSMGWSGYCLILLLLFGGSFHWLFIRFQKESVFTWKISPMIWILFWSGFVFGEGINYTRNALHSFLLGDLDYTAQSRMMAATFSGDFFQTQYYGWNENANFLSHHMTPSILLLSPFPMLFGPSLGFGIGIFFYSAITIPLLYFYLRECSISEELSLAATLLWAGSSSFYRLGHSLHFETLVPILFLVILYGVQKQKIWILIIGLFLFLGIKEDLSIYLSALSATLIFADPKRKRIWISVLILCVFYLLILHPIFRWMAGSSAERNWREYWGSGFENPISSIGIYIQNPESRFQYWKGLRDLSLEFGFWNLTAGWILIPFLGLYSIFRLSIHPWVRDLYSYYIYPLIPFLILFLRSGARKLQEKVEDSKRNFLMPDSRQQRWVYLILLTFLFSVYRNSKETEYPIPLSPKTQEAEELQSILKSIPEGGFVSAGFHLSPYLSLKNPTYPIRENRTLQKWILFHRKYNSPYLSSEKILKRVETEIKSGKIRIVERSENFILLQTSSAPSP